MGLEEYEIGGLEIYLQQQHSAQQTKTSPYKPKTNQRLLKCFLLLSGGNLRGEGSGG